MSRLLLPRISCARGSGVVLRKGWPGYAQGLGFDTAGVRFDVSLEGHRACLLCWHGTRKEKRSLFLRSPRTPRSNVGTNRVIPQNPNCPLGSASLAALYCTMQPELKWGACTRAVRVEGGGRGVPVFVVVWN